jgi:hypothetical protein
LAEDANDSQWAAGQHSSFQQPLSIEQRTKNSFFVGLLLMAVMMIPAENHKLLCHPKASSLL